MHSRYVGSIVWPFTKNEWNAPNTILSGMFGPSITSNLIKRVLTIYMYRMKLMQSTAFQQKHVDLYILSLPALCNLQLLLVVMCINLFFLIIYFMLFYFVSRELSRFIAAGRLNCKIDKVGGVVETNR